MLSRTSICAALYPMTSKQVRESIRLLPEDSAVYYPDPDAGKRGSRRRRTPAERRWATGMTAPNWGWLIAQSHFVAKRPLPPTIQDRAIRRAYYCLRGAQDEMMAITLSLLEPENSTRRFTLQGMLSAKDI